VLGASVAGSSHRAAGRGCDDAHGFRPLPHGGVLLAAADGAGSAPRGAQGAALAVRAAIDSVSCRLTAGMPPAGAIGWQSLLRTALLDARAALEGRGLTSPPDPRVCRIGGTAPTLCLDDFATTLLLAIVIDGWILALQVGDGAIVAWDAGGLRTLTRPDHGEYLNETVFVTSGDFLERAQYTVLRPDGASAVALFSDGLESLALCLASNEPHAPFFAPLFAYAGDPAADEGELAAFLDSPRVCARTDDDKTLVLAVRT
jgi:hypothetical protein